jgi:hypothetical protein
MWRLAAACARRSCGYRTDATGGTDNQYSDITGDLLDVEEIATLLPTEFTETQVD